MASEVSVSDPGDVGRGVFPKSLLDWSGSRSGGVRRLFDDKSGRPGGRVVETPLIQRLGNWARSFGESGGERPRIILLVGGPGNGKTEAIELTIGELDRSFGCGGRLVERLAAAFKPADGKVPRRVTVDLGSLASKPMKLALDVVQDATVESGEASAGQLLVSELATARAGGSGSIYLCCVNRGVRCLQGLDGPRLLLKPLRPIEPVSGPFIDEVRVQGREGKPILLDREKPLPSSAKQPKAQPSAASECIDKDGSFPIVPHTCPFSCIKRPRRHRSKASGICPFGS